MEDFQKSLSDLIAKSPAADIERNMRALLTQAFGKLDLVTREEFEIQAALLARTRTRVEQLAAQVDTLQAGSAGASSTTAASASAAPQYGAIHPPVA
jgi:BMFP domain-containing protein YqiC